MFQDTGPPGVSATPFFDYLRLYLAFSTGLHLLEEYLEWRQLKQDRKKNIPQAVYDYGILERAKDEESKAEAQEKFDKARRYNYDKRLFGMVTSWISYCISVVILLKLKPLLWDKSVELAESSGLKSLFHGSSYLPEAAAREIPEFLVFHFVSHYVDFPLGILTSLYSDFVIEERHGFNKKTLRLFFSDLVKSEILGFVFAVLLLPVVIGLIHWAGEMFYLYLWAFMQVFGVFMMWFLPNYIMPLFNTYEPIKDEDLRTKIEDLARKVNFPLFKIFQMDGSTRSAHSNAFFFGIWKYRRIVLYDTLLHLPHDAILAILGHELGHWKKGHTTFNLILGSVNLFLVFKVIGLVLFSEESKTIFASFGMGNASHSVMMGLMLISFLLEPLDAILERGTTCLTRVFEFQADRFAAVDLQMPEGLKEGLKKISEENKSGFNHDPYWAWYNLDHPTLLERLKAIDREVAAEKGRAGAVEMVEKKDQ
eukprot:g4599.t1